MAVVEWKGDAILARMAKAARQGVDETMGRAVIDAKKDVPRITTTYQGSIRFVPASFHQNLVRGKWGSFDVNYALAVETGDRSLARPGGRRGRDTGQPRINTGRTGSLRRARDKEYPKLADRIAARYKGAL